MGEGGGEASHAPETLLCRHNTFTFFRAEYRRDAQMVYQKRMLDATTGRGRFPPIRTFRPGLETSTNSVYHDMDHAERW